MTNTVDPIASSLAGMMTVSKEVIKPNEERGCYGRGDRAL